ncbi:FAD-dependent monooxygenase [Actinoplanes oblitus]|uniref:FAD-dependent monooxygenase n=1 Tax=Actinoplanes oblitus TaxID=3040509 RepID=A0ABY8W553_9ACTN|nr:FAD-dependent monooxygenase [Actinoplanes oblitus]WIM92966.1 FAD-dependent monooxygenase [Actinoplanes oblitus]
MDVERRPSAVVAGGGIGGLTAAIALHRAGWTVAVHERSATRQQIGAGLILWPNAVRALHTLGLAEALRSRAVALAGSGVRRPDGRWLSRTSADQMVARYGLPQLALTRAGLAELLTAALPPGCLRLGETVTGVDAGDPDRQASVRCGDRLVPADLVVAADGVNSRLRQTFWPAQPPAEFRGYVAWRALVRFPAAEIDGAGETWGRGERFGVVPIGPDLVYLYATANTTAREPGTAELAGLRSRFRRWHDPIPALLDAIEPGDLLRHDITAVHPALPRLHRGRVALLGDAGHAMEPNLGQGAGLAIEDAVVLAHAVADGSSTVAGLARYDRARTGRVTGLARQSRLLGRLTQSSSAAVTALRDLTVRLTPDRLGMRGFDAAAGWHPPAPRPAPAMPEERA